MHRAAFFFVLMAISCCSTACGIEFFVLSEPERAIYQIDLQSLGKPTLVGRLDSTGRLMGLVDLGDGELLTFDSTSDSMLTFDIEQGRVVNVTKVDRDLDPHVRGFTLDSKGLLYGVFPGLKLATINRVTGETAPVVTLHGAARIEAIAFGPGDRLFASGSTKNDGKSESLYRVNLNSGQLERVGAHGFADLDTLCFGGDTYFYGTNSRAEVMNELLRVTPRGRAKTVVGDTGVYGVNGIALRRSK